MVSPISLLPLELHVCILSQLSFTDQIRASQTCNLWNTLLANTKTLRSFRYQSPYDFPFFPLRTHKLLAPFTHRPDGIFPLDERLVLTQDERSVPSGLVFRVENRKVVECFYYEKHDDGEDMNGSLNFIDLLTNPTTILDESLFEPLVPNGIDPRYDSGDIFIPLVSKEKMFNFRFKWLAIYSRYAPPTVKEMLETILVKAWDRLESVYSDEPELIKCELDLPEGCWLAAHMLADAHTRDIGICLRRMAFSRNHFGIREG